MIPLICYLEELTKETESKIMITRGWSKGKWTVSV